jgi:flagellar FliJ protein
MPNFVFKLEGVLRQRTHLERQKQRELALRMQALTEAQQELERMRDAVAKSNDEVRQNHLVGSLDMSFLAGHRRFLLSMQRQAIAIAQKIAAAQQQVDEARKAVAEAAMQRKIIEKLREKHFDRWRAEIARKEMAEQDEIGMQMAYRNLVESEANAEVTGGIGPITDSDGHADGAA